MFLVDQVNWNKLELSENIGVISLFLSCLIYLDSFLRRLDQFDNHSSMAWEFKGVSRAHKTAAIQDFEYGTELSGPSLQEPPETYPRRESTRCRNVNSKDFHHIGSWPSSSSLQEPRGLVRGPHSKLSSRWRITPRPRHKLGIHPVCPCFVQVHEQNWQNPSFSPLFPSELVPQILRSTH